MDDFRFQSIHPRNALWVIESLMCAIVIGLVFGIAYIAYGFQAVVTPPVRPGPGLSYGQQVALIWLLMMILGATVGLAIGVARRFDLLSAALILVTAALLQGGVVAYLWDENVQRYGDHPSDWIVFAPALFVARVVFGIALLMAIAGWVWRPTSDEIA
jgi:hypothetical protein